MTSYRFRCLGPYYFTTKKDARGLKTFVPLLARDQVFDEAIVDATRIGIDDIRSAVGLYIFGLSPSGGPVTWPYYVGRASSQTLYARLFQANDKVEKYSKILNEYKRARPFVYLFPAVTEQGNLVRVAKRGSRSFKVIADAEYMMIGHAMSVNPFLHNIQDVVSRERFSIDGTPQSKSRHTKSTKYFRTMMQFEEMERRSEDIGGASVAAFKKGDDQKSVSDVVRVEVGDE